MAKDKLTDYDSTASGNLDVGGISVAEGMLPSGVNNAIRELMSHQADAFGAGTPLYVDQTNNRLGIGNAAPTTALDVTGTMTADGMTVDGASVFNQAASDQSGGAAVKANGTAYGTNKSIHAYMNTTNANRSLIYAENGAGAVFNVDGSGNVGIGGSPNAILDVQAGSGADVAKIRSGSTNGTYFWQFGRNNSSGFFELGQAQGGAVTNNLTIDTVGRVGISGQATFGNDVVLSNDAYLYSSNGGSGVRAGLFFDGTNQVVKGFTAGSEAMRIDSSGNVGIGTSSPSTTHRLTLDKSTNYGGISLNQSGTQVGQIIQEGGTGNIYIDADSAGTGGSLILRTNGGSERLRIDSSGRVTMPQQPSFAVTRNQGNVSNAVYVYPNAYHNTGNHYNSSNGRFTAPVAGSYFIATNHMSNNNATHTNVQYAIRVNGANQQLVYSSSGSAVHHRWSWAGVIYLNQGDYIDVFVASGLTLYGGDNSYTQFSGHLLG